MAGVNDLAGSQPSRMFRYPQRGTVARATADKAYVVLDRMPNRQVTCRYEPQVQLSGETLVAVAPPGGTRCVVLFPSRGAGGAVAVFNGRYASLNA